MKKSTCEGPEVDGKVVHLRDFREVGVAGAWKAREGVRKGGAGPWRSHGKVLELLTSCVTVFHLTAQQ